MPKLVSLIDPENAPSQRVAMRLGETKGPPIIVELYAAAFRPRFGRSVVAEDDTVQVTP
jgi:hypothetical protein